MPGLELVLEAGDELGQVVSSPGAGGIVTSFCFSSFPTLSFLGNEVQELGLGGREELGQVVSSLVPGGHGHFLFV